ncbi:MAG: CRISPR system precrRNA processing endoribonuclease RAMP protein Cas6 [Sulfolobales archaeon]|nr:CRISPR system precrRNA processing endoribonuclease RAMP protein Cas6 [Sulfolobales archaeon]
MFKVLRTKSLVRGFHGYLFSGKLVKTIVVRRLPELAELFKPTAGSAPKLIHVSPLFKRSSGGVKCIYSYAMCNNSEVIKCSKPITPIELNGSYDFYMGFTDSVLSLVKAIEALSSIDECFEFMKQEVCVTVQEVEYIDARALAREIVNRVIEVGRVKVVFASPTMLRDPLRRSKYKSFSPTPFNVFSTPTYILQYISGGYSPRRLRLHLTILHRLLNETYSITGTTRVKWILYGRSPEPTLVGYVNYHLNKDYVEQYSRVLSINEYLTEVFAASIALGVGVGRTAGFGHVFIEPGAVEST